MYSLDKTGAEAARKADSLGSSIKEIGKYVGTFTQAEDITAKTGTKGIALNFQTHDGQKSRLSIYTKRANGEQIMGYEMLMAIMACMALRNIKPVPGTVTHWNNETRAEESKTGSIFPELVGKPIGVLLETEDYEKQDGSVGTRMVLKNVFQAKTELTASEILDRKTAPEQLAKMVLGLRHRALKGAKSHARQSDPSQPESVRFDDDDLIPF